MTIRELIDRFSIYDEDACVILSDGNGWTNIEKVSEVGSCVMLVKEKSPLFSES